jgi:hypothetical protein
VAKNQYYDRYDLPFMFSLDKVWAKKSHESLKECSLLYFSLVINLFIFVNWKLTQSMNVDINYYYLSACGQAGSI